MVRKKDGFLGERSVILPPMIVEMEEKDPLVSSLYITDIGHYPMAEHHYRIRREPVCAHLLRGWKWFLQTEWKDLSGDP